MSKGQYQEGEDLSTRMPRLPKGTYLAAQRVLKSVWFGEPAPLQEAVHHVRMDTSEDISPEQVENALVEFINLLVRHIPALGAAETIEQIVSWREQSLRTMLTRGIPRLSQVSQEVQALYREAREKEERVRELRKRLAYLEGQEKRLTKQIATLAKNERFVQEELERVSGLHPVGIDRCLAMVQALAEQMQEGGDNSSDKTE